MSAATALLVALLAVPAAWLVLGWHHRDLLMRMWREPVLRHPVLILESDDWGPGPDGHAQALAALVDTLLRQRDRTGRPAVATIGVILGIPDAQAMRDDAVGGYRRRTLAEPDHSAMLEALRRGARSKALALQLHGLEHLWPEAFVKALRDPAGAARAWLKQGDGSHTEGLPSPLQSRWTDAAVLPSREISAAAVAAAASEEVALFARIFGASPEVAVPPTFVWTAEVEWAWAGAGVRCVVTPGRRLTCRDADGRPAGEDRWMLNGECGAGGITYIVRDLYFEPARGHRCGDVLPGIRDHFRLGRPALLETHRFNFVGSDEQRLAALAEIGALYDAVRREYPDLRFMSTAELGRVFAQRDARMLAASFGQRLHCWVLRLSRRSRLRKLGWLTGIGLPLLLCYLLTRPTGSATECRA